MKLKLGETLVWALFILLTFIVMLPPGWLVLTKFNFAYGVLHDHAGISEAIAYYAPRNDAKHDFELTSKAQRVELFRGIVNAIRNDGAGLEQLAYTDAKGRTIPLLTEAEIIHLNDVAKLINTTAWIAWLATVLWLVWVAWLYLRRQSLPDRRQTWISLFVLFILIVAILLSGPERVFNQLHIWVFPSEHQWFFYYEESLMSTMMEAPFLFAYIALMWSLLAMLFTFLVWQVLNRLLKYR